MGPFPNSQQQCSQERMDENTEMEDSLFITSSQKWHPVISCHSLLFEKKGFHVSGGAQFFVLCIAGIYNSTHSPPTRCQCGQKQKSRDIVKYSKGMNLLSLALAASNRYQLKPISRCIKPRRRGQRETSWWPHTSPCLMRQPTPLMLKVLNTVPLVTRSKGHWYKVTSHLF